MEVRHLLGLGKSIDIDQVAVTFGYISRHVCKEAATHQGDRKLYLHIQRSVRLAAQVRKCGWPALLPRQISALPNIMRQHRISANSRSPGILCYEPPSSLQTCQSRTSAKPLHATMAYAMWLKGLVILVTGVIAEAAFAPAPAPAGELSCISGSTRSLWPGTH